LKEKHKRLKGTLWKWNKKFYGNADARIEALTKYIEGLELKAESVGKSIFIFNIS
jgi:hypothetical protein